MKHFATLFLVLTLLVAISLPASVSPDVKPVTWNVALPSASFFFSNFTGARPITIPVASLTLAATNSDIKVIRIQSQQTLGNVNLSSNSPCSPLPQVVLSDGTTSFTVNMPGGNNFSSTPTSTDSGPIALSFLSGATITVKYVTSTDASCDDPGVGNLTVEYKLQ